MSTIYSILRCNKGAAYSKQQIIEESYLATKPNIEKPAGALAGRSRVHGDVSPEVQDRIVDILVELGARYKLPYRDIAHLLLICKLESGFNPDAAAGTSSGAGLGQYTAATVKEAAKPHVSKARLGFCLDLSNDYVFDAERGAYGILLSYMKCKELAIQHFENGYEQKLYLFHHEGWYFKPTPKNLAEDRPKQVLGIIKNSILPLLDQIETLLAARSELSFKLLTKDDQAYKDQPYLAIYPSQLSTTGRPGRIQGTAVKAKFIFGMTDGMGLTKPIAASALSEIVFLILTQNYKQLLDVDTQLGSEPLQEPDIDMPSKIANDSGTTAAGARLINHIANPTQVTAKQSLQLHTGDYLWRRPPMGMITTYLREALNMNENAAPALVEHKRSHIVLPEGNRAQMHGEHERVVVIRAASTTRELTDREKSTSVPHKTVEKAIKKKVTLAPKTIGKVVKEGLLFPLAKRPAESYRTGARAFNSSRAASRRHAGCDLYAPVGTEVRAMADGVIVQCYDFYWHTDAIEVDHGSFIARYGEVKRRTKNERQQIKGMSIKRGEVIGQVGQLIKPNKSLHKITMLHLELYGSNKSPLESESRLTRPDLRPFQRRADLIDPTATLDSCQLE